MKPIPVLTYMIISTLVSTCLSTSEYECLDLHSAMESGSHSSEKSLTLIRVFLKLGRRMGVFAKYEGDLKRNAQNAIPTE